MAVVGVLARIDSEKAAAVHGALNAIDGVSTFSVEDELCLGIMIERASVEAAHRALTDEIQPIAGLLSTWPVFVHTENNDPPQR